MEGGKEGMEGRGGGQGKNKWWWRGECWGHASSRAPGKIGKSTARTIRIGKYLFII
jgi:hypothetical protein